MKALQISTHFHPNIGGVETHLVDLIKSLIKRKWGVVMLSYCPLTTKAKWKIYEKNKNTEIFRIPWLPDLFYQLVSYPTFEFIYLVPGLFLVCPFIIISKKPDVIHAHGLIAGFVGVFWGKIFRKKVIISSHNIYHFPKKGLYRNFAKWIFNHADRTLGLSEKAVEEIKSLGIPGRSVKQFTYWIDLQLFKKIANTKKELDYNDKLVVLFAGRLVKEKGVSVLLESFKRWDKKIKLTIIGNGPLDASVKKIVRKFKDLEAIGIVDQKEMPNFYNSADLTIVPSVSEEGFGRVILESLACGTPVIGANRGGITEAMDESVGKLIKVTPDNIKSNIEHFLNHRAELRKLSSNCRKFAERRYTESNVETIIEAYQS